MRWKLVLVVFFVVIAGCSTSVQSDSETPTPAATVEINQSVDRFTADYSINSIESCGVTCKRVNITVEITNRLDGEVRYPEVMMSLYVVDNGTEILFFETDDERIDVWSETNWPDNISSGETLTYREDFKIGFDRAYKIIFQGDCVVYGEVGVDNGDIDWNQTKKIKIESGRCSNR